MMENISIRGNKKVWNEFVIAAKLKKDKIWDILLPTIDNYIEKNRKVKK